MAAIDSVIFDWHGTLANWPDNRSNYGVVLADFGYEVDPRVVDGYHARWDGTDHSEHSLSRDHYIAWTKARLEQFVQTCGVSAADVDKVVQALIDSDHAAPMATYPEVPDVLTTLRERGYRIAICSNWGWDLEPFLSDTEVLPHVDVALTSARVGYRKPHPAIYRAVTSELGTTPASCLFVGDSWAPDVLGPIEAGMAAVHVWRWGPAGLPDLPERAMRVESLDEILAAPLLTN